MPELPLDEQIKNKIFDVDESYKSLCQAMSINLLDIERLEPLYIQLSAERMKLAELQLLDLNQHNY